MNYGGGVLFYSGGRYPLADARLTLLPYTFNLIPCIVLCSASVPAASCFAPRVLFLIFVGAAFTRLRQAILRRADGPASELLHGGKNVWQVQHRAITSARLLLTERWVD